MAEWTDYRAAADKAAKWANALELQGRDEDGLLMRLLGGAAEEKAEALAVAAIAEAPGQRDTSERPVCSLCGMTGMLDAGGRTATCFNPDCCRCGRPVAVSMFVKEEAANG
jgi:putative intracellular protease/amidase